jgi:hypothetical protein
MPHPEKAIDYGQWLAKLERNSREVGIHHAHSMVRGFKEDLGRSISRQGLHDVFEQATSGRELMGDTRANEHCTSASGASALDDG